MSFLGPLIVPQSRDQAIQRDHIHGHTPIPLTDPAGELHKLRQAIREHQAAVSEAGSLGLAADFSERQRDVLARKHQADHKLWEQARP